MFLKTTWVGFGIFGLLSGIWFFSFCIVRKSDYASYKTCIESQKNASFSEASSQTNQTRQGVRKDIWFAQEDGTRLHYCIESESSILTLIPSKGKFDVLENLHHMKCWMQDKLYYAAGKEQPMQQIRYFEADEGTYQYTTQNFNAHTVALSLFRLPGHDLIIEKDQKSAFLNGNAEDVSFTVSGKTPQFEAKHFKAILNPQ